MSQWFLRGNVRGDIRGNMRGDIRGNVRGDIRVEYGVACRSHVGSMRVAVDVTYAG